MKVETFACDVCQVQKKDANHWWKVTTREGIAVIAAWEVTTFDGIAPNVISEDKTAHLCGGECVVKYIGKNLLHRDA